MPMKSKTWCLSITLQVSHKNSRRKWPYCSISNRTSSKTMMKRRSSNSWPGTKKTWLTKPSSLQVQSTSKSGWERSMPSCSVWATRSFRLTFRIIRRFCWIRRTDLWRMLTRREREVPCHLIKRLIATMRKWLKDWNIPKISWPTC